MKNTETYINPGWLLEVARGDEMAFRRLYDRYKDQVYSFALGVTRSVHLAEEIVQEGFIKLWLYKDQLPGIQHFESWFFTIIRNLCYSALRKIAVEIKTRMALEQKAAEQVITADEITIMRENRKLVQEAINLLSEQQRNVYILSREEGLTYEQIADRLQISRNTVKEHLGRAVEAIKKHLNKKLTVITALLGCIFID